MIFIVHDCAFFRTTSFFRRQWIRQSEYGISQGMNACAAFNTLTLWQPLLSIRGWVIFSASFMRLLHENYVINLWMSRLSSVDSHFRIRFPSRYLFNPWTLLTMSRVYCSDVETEPALFRANTHPKRFTNGCTRKFTLYLLFLLIS